MGLMKAHGAQTRTCATQGPPDSCGLGYYLRDHGPKRGNISTDFQRQGAEYPPAHLSCVEMNGCILDLIRVPGAQTRICATMAPPDLWALKDYLGDQSL
mgnify:CR=1 FL=1